MSFMGQKYPRALCPRMIILKKELDNNQVLRLSTI